MIDKYLHYLIKQVDDKCDQIQESLASGAAKDFPEYKAMAGEVKGLLSAKRMIIDLQERLKESDDD
ncbi:hypothetical protein UFOVP274_6 [uncultured Caudovirales phage]|uniref:Uncharacterized protein n=1 Tax=uncultured Caudovirales phage TaxID=2100421 RepID=A0A6J5LKA0_9CAUD|nr:hypothetical protein UFOVP274_6 [uncultured Caudovirales phage]